MIACSSIFGCKCKDEGMRLSRIKQDLYVYNHQWHSLNSFTPTPKTMPNHGQLPDIDDNAH